MRRQLATLLLALLVAAPAAAQQITLPANTVYGRLGIGTGPGQAIPFATLFAQQGSTAGALPFIINGSGSLNTQLPSFQGITPTLWLLGPQTSPTQGETILLMDSYGANANATIVGSKSGGAQFTGRIDNGTPGVAGTVLTVSAMANLNGTTAPNSIAAGQTLFSSTGLTITDGTKIVSQLSGTSGGVGTYQVNLAQSVASTSIFANDPPTNPQITQDGNIIFFLSANGWAGSPAQRTTGSAGMLIEAEPGGGNWTTSSTPTRFRFVTTPTGCISTTCGNVDRLYIESTGEIVARQDGVAASSVLGYTLRNYTAATSGAQIQNSPSLHWRGSAWDTSALTSKAVEWIGSAAAIAGNPPTTSLTFSYSVNGAGYTRAFSATSSGTLDTPNGYTIGGAAATAGHVLRGNGTAFVDSQLADTDLSGTAWTSYTPTVSAGTGTFTSASATGASKTIGKTVFFRAKITITTNGTAASFISLTLPANSVGTNLHAVSGFRAADSALVAGNITSTTVNIFKYDGTYPGADGGIIWVSGVYEKS